MKNEGIQSNYATTNNYATLKLKCNTENDAGRYFSRHQRVWTLSWCYFFNDCPLRVAGERGLFVGSWRLDFCALLTHWHRHWYWNSKKLVLMTDRMSRLSVLSTSTHLSSSRSMGQWIETCEQTITRSSKLKWMNSQIRLFRSKFGGLWRRPTVVQERKVVLSGFCFLLYWLAMFRMSEWRQQVATVMFFCLLVPLLNVTVTQNCRLFLCSLFSMCLGQI